MEEKLIKYSLESLRLIKLSEKAVYMKELPRPLYIVDRATLKHKTFKQKRLKCSFIFRCGRLPAMAVSRKRKGAL